jgi:hypothetical protein
MASSYIPGGTRHTQICAIVFHHIFKCFELFTVQNTRFLSLLAFSVLTPCVAGATGLGVRQKFDNGVAGGYAYFDRKRSGLTDKYHTQATVGAEWLTENWEVRANGYIPLTGDAQVSRGRIVSDPFLSGSGIYIRETGVTTLRETPLQGGDIEAGFKIPTTNFWVHAGAFSFSGDDVPSLDGVRARATFEITQNIALTAEGQYDDERGRMGWLGVRLTMPFGEPAKNPPAWQPHPCAILIS